jgi:hypothetical protein
MADRPEQNGRGPCFEQHLDGIFLPILNAMLKSRTPWWVAASQSA